MDKKIEIPFSDSSSTWLQLRVKMTKKISLFRRGLNAIRKHPVRTGVTVVGATLATLLLPGVSAAVGVKLALTQILAAKVAEAVGGAAVAGVVGSFFGRKKQETEDGNQNTEERDRQTEIPGP